MRLKGVHSDESDSLMLDDEEESILHKSGVRTYNTGCLGKWRSLSLKWKISIFSAIILLIIVGLIVIIVPTVVLESSSSGYCSDEASRLIDSLMDPSKNLAYSRLAEMADTFGPRLSGSTNLENAIDWIYDQMVTDDLNPVKEPVMVPKWIRGSGTVQLIEPFTRELGFLALGGSSGTGPTGIQAEVVVVRSNDEIISLGRSVIQNRIVVINYEWQGSYGATTPSRTTGPSIASTYGAVACLVRSITPYSLYTPHTGSTSWDDVTPIPAIAITIEDAELLQRLQADENTTLTMSITLDSRFDADAQSYNIMGEIKGTDFPNEVVLIGGHIDSWDVGQGAIDDAGGVFASWEALRHIKLLGLTPKRTVRAIGWTNEENGLRGALEYAASHQDEDHVLAIESDSGTNAAGGLNFTGPSRAFGTLQGIASLLDDIDGGALGANGGGADIGPLMSAGVPGANLYSADGREEYFWYHHTNADTVDKIVEEDLRRASAILAVHAFCVANVIM
eukprot:TRINITY_DN6688_c0_g1_i3.p1 TRINITY_DN6688_c0_g1~~TRINITY_DN6688_c0_g1_i3.p1  ORF type:complete len:506 (-),score=82.73 TRINITY_DN6688_c0_g1_i3:441-1958(-)